MAQVLVCENKTCNKCQSRSALVCKEIMIPVFKRVLPLVCVLVYMCSRGAERGLINETKVKTTPQNVEVTSVTVLKTNKQ